MDSDATVWLVFDHRDRVSRVHRHADQAREDAKRIKGRAEAWHVHGVHEEKEKA